MNEHLTWNHNFATGSSFPLEIQLGYARQSNGQNYLLVEGP